MALKTAVVASCSTAGGYGSPAWVPRNFIRNLRDNLCLIALVNCFITTLIGIEKDNPQF